MTTLYQVCKLICAKSLTVPIPQNVILNICGGLLSLPIVFLSHDLYQIIRTRKQREMVIMQISSDVEKLFTSFIFMIYKLRKEFAIAVNEIPEFLNSRKSNVQEIFDDISSLNHKGFFLFSKFDNYCELINGILASPLFLSYLPNSNISLLSEFSINYQRLLEEFKLISEDDFIESGTDENLQFAISDETQSSREAYKVMQNNEGKQYVLYLATFPIFDETMLKKTYRISGIKAKRLSEQIFALYSLILKWEHICKKPLSVDSIFVSFGRLCKDSNINMHAYNNVAINIEWAD